MWLDVRDATNRPVPFWVRSEAGPTKLVGAGRTRFVSSSDGRCGGGGWCVRKPHSRSSFRDSPTPVVFDRGVVELEGCPRLAS